MSILIFVFFAAIKALIKRTSWKDEKHDLVSKWFGHKNVSPIHSQIARSRLFLFLVKYGSSSRCPIHFRPLTDSKSNVRTVSAVRGSVIGCTQNLLLGSLWTDQSSLTYVFKAALLAACSSFHGNPNAISPYCLDRSISRKLFQTPGLLKPQRPTVHYDGVCLSYICVYMLLKYFSVWLC